jgi:hypothetical protein
MRAQLASQLLNSLLGAGDELDDLLPRLQAHAMWKWDSYEGFRAGQRFLESLARWLQEFDDVEVRTRWLNFVLNELVFISAQEMDHAIATAYETALRPSIIPRAASRLGVPAYRTSLITSSREFKEEQRRTLILGLSDGARLDQLRRSNTELSHEQYVPSIHIDEGRQRELIEELDKALTMYKSTAERTFTHVVLVDDFYGSGTSLIKLKENSSGAPSELGGKVRKFCDRHLTQESVLQEGDASEGSAEEGVARTSRLLADDFDATILLYVASERASEYIEHTLERAGLAWKLQVMQRISDKHCVGDVALVADCHEFWDPVLFDRHKGHCPVGYKDCALPVVLHHNAPNNSVCPLWADSAGRGGKDRHALFPRYERHHEDRP